MKRSFLFFNFYWFNAFKTIQKTWVNDDPHTQLNFGLPI